MDSERYERKMARLQERLERRRHRSGSGGLLIGALIITVGVVLLLENMGLLRFSDIWNYWPVALIVLGASRILESQRPAALVWGGLLVGAGALLLLDNLGILMLDFRMIWPVVLIAFGVSLLLRGIDRGNYLAGEPVSSDAALSLYGIFSGGKRRIESADFRGGEAFAFCGGFDLDFRGSKMPSGRAVFDVNAIFGGCQIKVPATWRVNVQGMGIFGAFEDKTIPPPQEEGVTPPELVLTGMAIFGGVDVRN